MQKLAELTMPTDAPDYAGLGTDVGATAATGLVDAFTGVLPYAVAVMLAFTVVAIAIRLLGLRKRAR